MRRYEAYSLHLRLAGPRHAAFLRKLLKARGKTSKRVGQTVQDFSRGVRLFQACSIPAFPMGTNVLLIVSSILAR